MEHLAPVEICGKDIRDWHAVREACSDYCRWGPIATYESGMDQTEIAPTPIKSQEVFVREDNGFMHYVRLGKSIVVVCAFANDDDLFSNQNIAQWLPSKDLVTISIKGEFSKVAHFYLPMIALNLLDRVKRGENNPNCPVIIANLDRSIIRIGNVLKFDDDTILMESHGKQVAASFWNDGRITFGWEVYDLYWVEVGLLDFFEAAHQLEGYPSEKKKLMDWPSKTRSD